MRTCWKGFPIAILAEPPELLLAQGILCDGASHHIRVSLTLMLTFPLSDVSELRLQAVK
jgi:hypothetical protein